MRLKKPKILAVLTVCLALAVPAMTSTAALGQSLGWWVVMYSGQHVMGPFTLLTDCSREAQRLSQEYYNVSSVCRYE